MIDVHRLRVFRAVVASGSIQAAAGNLGYTPSAVSQHVTALQRETGLTLICRSGRGIEPTPAGLELAAMTDGVIDRLGQLETRVRDLREGRTGVLRMVYFESVGQNWMPIVARELTRRFPAVRLDLVLDEDVPTRVDVGVDLQVIVDDEGYEPPTGLLRVPLVTEPYVAVLPREHPMAAAPVIDLARLAGETWIDNEPATGRCRMRLLKACAAAGISPTYGVQTQDHMTAIAFVAASVGITVVPRLCTKGLRDGVVAVPVHNPTPTRTVTALVNRAVEHAGPVELALATLRRCAQEESELGCGTAAPLDGRSAPLDATLEPVPAGPRFGLR